MKHFNVLLSYFLVLSLLLIHTKGSDATKPKVFDYVKTMGFRCFGQTGIETAVRINGHNEIECVSTDGKSCIWGLNTDAKCMEVANAQNLQKITTLECGMAHKRLHGTNGYDNPGHWCEKGLKYFFGGFQCGNKSGMKESIRLNKDTGDIECMSKDFVNCYVAKDAVKVCESHNSCKKNKHGKVFTEAAKFMSPPAITGVINCNAYKQKLGHSGFEAKGKHWCKTALSYFRFTGDWRFNSSTHMNEIVRLGPDGNLECITKGGGKCLIVRGGDSKQREIVEKITKGFKEDPKVIPCGKGASKGKTGFEEGTWCHKAKFALIYKKKAPESPIEKHLRKKKEKRAAAKLKKAAKKRAKAAKKNGGKSSGKGSPKKGGKPIGKKGSPKKGGKSSRKGSAKKGGKPSAKKGGKPSAKKGGKPSAKKGGNGKKGGKPSTKKGGKGKGKKGGKGKGKDKIGGKGKDKKGGKGKTGKKGKKGGKGKEGPSEFPWRGKIFGSKKTKLTLPTWRKSGLSKKEAKGRKKQDAAKKAKAKKANKKGKKGVSVVTNPGWRAEGAKKKTIKPKTKVPSGVGQTWRTINYKVKGTPKKNTRKKQKKSSKKEDDSWRSTSDMYKKKGQKLDTKPKLKSSKFGYSSKWTPLMKKINFFTKQGTTLGDGSKIKLAHILTKNFLHSHDKLYNTGSKQQEITAYWKRDDGDWWIIKAKGKKTLKSGDIIQLTHAKTGKNLHSHHSLSPTTHSQEVSGYGDNGKGDSNDNWRLIITESYVHLDQNWKIGDIFRLVHKNSGAYLNSSTAKTKVSKQQEVAASTNGNDSCEWTVVEKFIK